MDSCEFPAPNPRWLWSAQYGPSGALAQVGRLAWLVPYKRGVSLREAEVALTEAEIRTLRKLGGASLQRQEQILSWSLRREHKRVVMQGLRWCTRPHSVHQGALVPSMLALFLLEHARPAVLLSTSPTFPRSPAPSNIH